MDPGVAHETLTRRLRQALAREAPPPGEASPCPYLPGRRARRVVLAAAPLPGVYHALMDCNFRRLGPVFYRPTCESCAECRMLRLVVSEFRPSRAQRRCAARNRDLEVELGEPRPTPEKHALYRRYLETRHDGQMDGSVEEFGQFLYESPLDSVEMVYRLEGRVVGVGIVDREPLAWSAVYCYFEPDLPGRSLGVFNVLALVEECRRRGVPYLYLGYYVRGCAAMAYKASYRPHEVLEEGGRFRAPE
jgi:arginyl-tRNA--protein-N-Asp/Glu arginylyltransferase